jgi:2'-5' RNA ligase
VTLRFLGEVDREGAAAVCAALDRLPLPGPISLRLGRGGSFPPAGGGRRRPPSALWIGVDRGAPELARLAGLVDEALAPLGFDRPDKPFAPHLTLGRVRRAARDDWAEALGRCGGGTWPDVPVTGLVLWRSDLLADGARHTVVRRFPPDSRDG